MQQIQNIRVRGFRAVSGHMSKYYKR